MIRIRISQCNVPDDGFFNSVISSQEQLSLVRCCVRTIKMLKFQLFVVFIAGLQVSRGFNNLNNPIIFYDLKTRQPLEPPVTKTLPDSEHESFNMSSVINIRLPFIGQPCK